MSADTVLTIIDFVDEGLGHSSYLIDLEDGRALVIDPPRIPDAQLVHARAEGLDVAFTADTHTHADYVSGSPELAAQGVTFLAPTAAGLQTGHRGLRGGDEINFGRLTLRALDTPGHTPDHLAYLLLEAGQPVALFSGGSLMVGTVGRTDLLGDDYTEDLARAQYRSLHEQILTLPDDLAVYPTHGRGSFCSAPGATERTTTVGRERATNPLLQGADEDAFVRTLVASFGTLPSYFTRLPELNRRGPKLYGNLPTLARLTVDAVQRRLAEGAVIVDARPIDRYAAGHIRGAVSHALRPAFGTWLASTVSPDSPHVMILDADQDERELVRQALNVGHDNLAGLLDGGIDAWRTAELPISATETVDASVIDGTVVDVRQHDEFIAGHVAAASNVELSAMRDDAVISSPVTVMCGHGERAMTAASLLARAGHRDVRVVIGGPDDWSRRTGRPLEVSG